jgi:hypothetical protein|tara:strand:- start:58 stop:303 length:246 start_codon:yes stop_codon:yes gene_type:complete
MNSNFKIETNNVRNVVVEWGDKNFVSVVEWPNRDGFDINFDTGLQLSLSKTQFFALLQSTLRLNLEDSLDNEQQSKELQSQ